MTNKIVIICPERGGAGLVGDVLGRVLDLDYNSFDTSREATRFAQLTKKGIIRLSQRTVEDRWPFDTSVMRMGRNSHDVVISKLGTLVFYYHTDADAKDWMDPQELKFARLFNVDETEKALVSPSLLVGRALLKSRQLLINYYRDLRPYLGTRWRYEFFLDQPKIEFKRLLNTLQLDTPEVLQRLDEVLAKPRPTIPQPNMGGRRHHTSLSPMLLNELVKLEGRLV